MGLAQTLTNFRNAVHNMMQPVKFLNYSAPHLYMTGGLTEYKLEASDAVNQVISCIAQEIKKVEPCHIRTINGDDVPQESNVQWILDNPNESMTTSQFLEKCIRLLLLNYNLFIIPTFNIYKDKYGNTKRKLTGLYPVLPTTVDFLQDRKGTVGVRFVFGNMYETILNYSDVIHIKYNFGKHEFCGGTLQGKPDNESLLELAQMNNDLVQGIAKGLKASYAVNGIIKYNTMLDQGTMENNIKTMEKKLRDSESGFMPMDLKGEFIPLTKDPKLVDEATLKFLDEKILRYYGVSLSVLSGNFTAEEHGAFYQRACEHILVEFGQEFTKVLFTDRERQVGNKIVFYPKELYFMDITQKLQLFDMLVDTQSCYQNELRTAFGLKPIPELAGKLATSSQKQYAVNGALNKNAEDNAEDIYKNKPDTYNKNVVNDDNNQKVKQDEENG